MQKTLLIFFLLNPSLYAGYSQKPKGVQCQRPNSKLSKDTKQTSAPRALRADELRVYVQQIKCGDCAIKLKKFFSEEKLAGTNLYSNIEVDIERNFISLKRNIKSFSIEQSIIKELRSLGFLPLKAEVYGEKKMRFFKNRQKPLLLKDAISVRVDGMSCGFCAKSIKKKLTELENVKSIEVSIENKVVFIKTKEKKDVSDQQIKTKITEAGYKVASIKR